MSKANFHGPKDVRAIEAFEVWLYILGKEGNIAKIKKTLGSTNLLIKILLWSRITRI